MASVTGMCVASAPSGASAARRAPSSRALAPAAAFVHSTRPCSSATCLRRVALAPQRQAAARRAVAVRAEGSSGDAKRNTEFGYSRKDVILIGVGMIGGGYGLYYGLQATGMEPGIAGNWAQLIIFVGLTFGWVGSYLFRVATKQMTYVKQLDDYEEAVMRKRLDEMPDQELERVLGEVEDEKEERQARRQRRQQEQEKQQ